MSSKASDRSKANKRRLAKQGFVLLLVVFAAVILVSSWTSAPIVYATEDYSPSVFSPVSIPWPTYGESAVGAMGYGVFASEGPQIMLPTASVAKIITALTVLKQYPLSPGQQGPTITLGAADVASYQHYISLNGSVVLVVAGEQITEYQALEAMLLPSANNMADSLATWSFGSMAAYDNAANQFLNSNGLKNTVVANDASGFLPNTKSTASDLVKLGELALNNPVLAQIVGQTQAVIPDAGIVMNVNSLLGQNGIVGIKTGNTDQAGGVYMFAADYSLTPGNSVTIVGSIMGAPTLKKALSDSIPLLLASEKNLQLDSVISAGQVVGHYKTQWNNDTVNAVAQKTIDVPVWGGHTTTPQFYLNPLKPPKAAGSVVGNVTVNLEGLSKSSPVQLSQPLTEQPWYRRILHPSFMH